MTSGAIQFRVQTEGVQAVLDGMPKVAYFWFRDYLFRSFVAHRTSWLRTKSTKFGRAAGGALGGRGIRVSQVNEDDGPLGDNEVRYTVVPAERRQRTREAAVAGMREMGAEAATGNLVLGVHEFGTDIEAKNQRTGMWIPIRTRPGNIRAWRAKNPNKKTLLLPSKRGDGSRLLYEVQSVGRRGRPRKGQPTPPKTEKLRLRFVVVRKVDMKPTLKFYESWDAMGSDRDRLFREAATKMVRDMERGDPRDL